MARIMNGDLVVVVPGILGSSLRRGHRQTWGYRQLLLNLHHLTDRLTEDLSLPSAAFEHPTDGWDDGTKVTGIMTTQGILPGFLTIDGYDDLLFLLRTRFMHEQHCILDFPYDWRQSCEHTARRLAAFVEPILLERRRSHPNARLILIGHSMGGLVSRYYAECLDTHKFTRRVVTIGTPYRGAARALAVLANGYAAVGPVKAHIGDLARSLPSVAELLPVYECLGPSADSLRPLDVSPAVAGLPDVALARCLDFHDRIDEAITANGDQRPTYHALLSHRQATDVWASIDDDGEVLAHQPRSFEERGDGTVPRRSATPPEWPDDAAGHFLAGRHAALQQQPATVVQLQAILTAQPRRPQATLDEIAVDALPCAQAGQDWTVEAQSVEGANGLVLTVTVTDPALPKDSPAIADKPLRPHGDGQYSAAIKLTQPGMFRWTVHTQATGATLLDPVSDVLLCLPE